MTKTEYSKADVCPHCTSPGRPVAIHTVRALVSTSLQMLETDGYRFCSTPECSTVYYHRTSDHCIYDSDLRELVFQKHVNNPQVLICYCFRHTLGDVCSADTTQVAQIVANIREGVQRQQCACDIRNPQGSCCLGNIQRLLRDGN